MRISDWSSDVCSSDLGAADDLRTRGLRDRDRLAGDHGFIHVGRAVDHLSVHRNLLAGADQEDIADRHLVERNLNRLAIAHHARRLGLQRSEEHTSELQSLMRISYAVFCLKKKKQIYHN